jgi:eukaryotic-like serine/threonine-protein kinase
MIEVNDWVGREIAGGRYKVLERLGVGSMGQVFLAFDRHLETQVVVKCPVPEGAETIGDALLKRFDLEIRSLVHLSHPQIVRIIDVGVEDGHPYVVMQYLPGGSLRDRMVAGPAGAARPMPIHSLWDWLMDIARALDFIHSQNYLHRDVKPENILFDRFGNAFLADFGIIKMLTGGPEDWGANRMTAPGFLMGTPNYVAPEVVLGHGDDARMDQYSLAMTVHEVVTGSNCMEGPTPSATMVNQTKLEPPPLSRLLRGVPERMAEAVRRGLSKDPAGRFESCTAFAAEVLAEAPSGSTSRLVALTVERAVSPEPGQVTCPVCSRALPVGEANAGERVKCPRCSATLLVQVPKPGLVNLAVVGQPSRSWATAVPTVRPAAEPTTTGRHSAGAGVATGRSTAEVVGADTPRRGGGRAWLTYGLVGLVLLTCGLILRREVMNIFRPGTQRTALRPAGPGDDPAGPDARSNPAPTAEPIVVNIVYGTEKQRWLEDALKAYRETPASRGVRINLIGMGSVEGANAVLDGPEPAAPPHLPIHVWSPASSAYRDVLERDWRVKHGASAILAAENLALTPMVFVMWKHRYEAFVKRFGKVSFRTLGEAMAEPEGWGKIAERPEWGLFKLGHTDPNKSNSGLQVLVLMAYEFAGKQRGLTLEDITTQRFQDWLRRFERGITRHGSSLTNSTGNLMKEMVLRGPSQYDCLVVYENLATDYMEAARQKWGTEGEFYVAYPDPNVFNEHPYYILDVPWSDDRQRKAAADFLSFLMSEPVQRRALDHGFRPGNPDVAVNLPDSPLVGHQTSGLKIHLPVISEPPSADVITNLLGSFRRLEPGR